MTNTNVFLKKKRYYVQQNKMSEEKMLPAIPIKNCKKVFETITNIIVI